MEKPNSLEILSIQNKIRKSTEKEVPITREQAKLCCSLLRTSAAWMNSLARYIGSHGTVPKEFQFLLTAAFSLSERDQLIHDRKNGRHS